jgi:hypothetical protein
MPSATRVARNESFFREVNERISDLADTFWDSRDEIQRFVCECSRADCSQAIELSLDEYSEVRANDVQFAVSPGHVDTANEQVVRRTDRFWVVAKNGATGEIAREETR